MRHFIRTGIFLGIIAPLIFFYRATADTTLVLRPIADGGNDSASWFTTGGAACSGTSCYLEVHEASGSSCTDSDGDASYIRTAASSVSQTFDIDASGIPDGATITRIDITLCDRRDQGGARIQTRRCVDGSCTNSGTPIVSENSYTEHTQSHTGLNIVKSSGTDIEIGVSTVTDKGIRVSQVSAMITYTLPADTTAPAAVANLSVSNQTASSLDLSWTAPGDDGSSGTAASYDVRYATIAITDANWSSATQASGEPVPSAAGTGESFTVNGLSPETAYFFALKTSDEVPNVSALSNVPNGTTSGISPPPPPPGSGSSGVIPSFIAFSGKAYPGSTIEILQKSTIGGVYAPVSTAPESTDAGGNFSMQYSGLTDAFYFFALRVTDADGRQTGIIPFFSANFASGQVVSEGIRIPPTLGLKETFIVKGGQVELAGYAIPDSEVTIEVDGTVQGATQSGANGAWKYAFSSDALQAGTHQVRAQSTGSDGVETDPSSFAAFKISLLALPQVDLNEDSDITIADWSIFLFRWGSGDPSLQSEIDMNGDGIINIADFSIFLKGFKA